MIYLASPYTHIDPTVRGKRYRAVLRATARLIMGGHVVFSPIVHSHELALLIPQKGIYGIDFWKEWDVGILRRCEQLWVLTLPGYLESTGIRSEMEIADAMYMPTAMVPPTEEELKELE